MSLSLCLILHLPHFLSLLYRSVFQSSWATCPQRWAFIIVYEINCSFFWVKKQKLNQLNIKQRSKVQKQIIWAYLAYLNKFDLRLESKCFTYPNHSPTPTTKSLKLSSIVNVIFKATLWLITSNLSNLGWLIRFVFFNIHTHLHIYDSTYGCYDIYDSTCGSSNTYGCYDIKTVTYDSTYGGKKNTLHK